jgi:hypothetical protein
VSDLVAFLNARLDEDEMVAKPFVNGLGDASQWECDEVGGVIRKHGVPIMHLETHLDAEFIARHDPARVLADVEAKRRIVREATYWSVDARPISPNARQFAGDTLRLLALPFAGHPDYREEWRP